MTPLSLSMDEATRSTLLPALNIPQSKSPMSRKGRVRKILWG